MISLKRMLSKPLWWSGWFLLLAGIAHVPVWLLSGSEWEGSISWRKPILFGVSTGMTLCSLGWLADHVGERFRKVTSFIEWLISVALLLEVALITLQQWRGVASHFNNQTRFDSQIDSAMLLLICIAVAGITYLFARCFGKLDLEADYAMALRSGMIFLVISCVIGFVISAYGYQRVAADLSPESVGDHGVPKFPHGIAIHALQFLPGVVLVMRWFDFQVEIIKQVVWYLSVSFAMQLAFAVHQTACGYSRFQLENGLSILLASFVLLSAVLPCVIVGWKTFASRSTALS